MLRQRILKKRLGQHHGDPNLLLEQNSVSEKIKGLRENMYLNQQVSLAWHYSGTLSGQLNRGNVRSLTIHLLYYGLIGFSALTPDIPLLGGAPG